MKTITLIMILYDNGGLKVFGFFEMYWIIIVSFRNQNHFRGHKKLHGKQQGSSSKIRIMHYPDQKQEGKCS